jgi:Holliday junction resolvasome RuvABC endonuclease subunit
MTIINLTLELPEALAEEAQAAGLLSSERIVAMLEMELRRAAWDKFSAAAAQVRAAAAGEFGDLSEEQIRELVEAEIHLMRAEDETDASQTTADSA